MVERISHGTHIHDTHLHDFSMGNTFLVSAFGGYWLELCKIQKNFLNFFDDFEWDSGTWVGILELDKMGWCVTGAGTFQARPGFY